MRKVPSFDKKPIYLNADIIYSQIVAELRDKNGKTLKKLNDRYSLVTSILTRMEIIQNLHLNKSVPVNIARRLYIKTLEFFEIYEINSLHKSVPLTDDFIESVAKSNLQFKDALHLHIAKKAEMPVCTHDKKMKNSYSQMESKERFYSDVYKPEELI